MMTNHLNHPLITYYIKCVRRIYLSLYGHKFDLIYCQWNKRESGSFPNISFLMLLIIILYHNILSSLGPINNFSHEHVQNTAASQLDSNKRYRSHGPKIETSYRPTSH